MSDPHTIIDDTLASIAANPRDTAVLCLASAIENRDEDVTERAVAYLGIADPDSHPDAYTLDEMDALDAAATRVQLAVQALRYMRKVREATSLRSFDDAEAQVQGAARELGRALGGAR